MSAQLAGCGGSTSTSSTLATGALVRLGSDLMTGLTTNANTFMSTASASGDFMYFLNITEGSVSTYSVSSSGALTRVGNPLATGSGSGSTKPTGIALAPNGRFAYITNFAEGTVSTYSVNTTTGALTKVGVDITTGDGVDSFPIDIKITSTGSFIYVLNEIDGTISTFSVNSTTGALTKNGADVLAGNTADSIPCAMAINGLFLYTVELDDGEIAAFSINNTTGALTKSATHVFSGTGEYSYPIDIKITSNGRFLYTANLGESTISAFSITAATGALTKIGDDVFTGTDFAGTNNIALSPSGEYAYVANMNEGSITTFAIGLTGALTKLTTDTLTGKGATDTAPIAISVSPNGKYAYVVNTNEGTVSSFSIKTSTSTSSLNYQPNTQAISSVTVPESASGNTKAFSQDLNSKYVVTKKAKKEGK